MDDIYTAHAKKKTWFPGFPYMFPEPNPDDISTKRLEQLEATHLAYRGGFHTWGYPTMDDLGLPPMT